MQPTAEVRLPDEAPTPAAGPPLGPGQPPAAALAAATPDAGAVRPAATPASPPAHAAAEPKRPAAARPAEGASRASAHENPSANAGPSPAALKAAAALAGTVLSTADRDGGAQAQVKAGGPDAGTARAETKASAAGEARRASARPPAEDDPGLRRVARFTASGGAALKGRAMDADTGKPIAGAIIDARLGDSFVEVETDAAGAFRMPGMLPGSRVTVWVVGRPDLYVAESMSITIPGEGETADTGVVRLIHGNETAARLQGWVGLFVTRRGHSNVVGAISPWLSADRAGIQVGDVLLSIDGHDVSNLGPRATSFLLRGPAGTKANIVAQDSQGTLRKVELDRIVR